MLLWDPQLLAVSAAGPLPTGTPGLRSVMQFVITGCSWACCKRLTDHMLAQAICVLMHGLSWA